MSTCTENKRCRQKRVRDKRHVGRPFTLTYNKYSIFLPLFFSPSSRPSFLATMSFSRPLVSPSAPQVASNPSVSNVESMFSQIMEVVLKSVSASRRRACSPTP